MIGNKLDLEAGGERKVTQDEGRKLAEEFGCPWMETSAKARIRVEDAFYEVRPALPAPPRLPRLPPRPPAPARPRRTSPHRLRRRAAAHAPAAALPPPPRDTERTRGAAQLVREIRKDQAVGRRSSRRRSRRWLRAPLSAAHPGQPEESARSGRESERPLCV